MEFLKERALQFLVSRAAAKRGFYELTLFHAKQALQLYTKYLIYRELGDFPKTRFPLDLLDKVLELYGAVCNRRLPPTSFCCIGVARTRVYNLSLHPLRARREDCEVAHDALFYMESSIPCGTRCSVLTTSGSRE